MASLPSADQLYGRAPQAVVLGVAGGRFGMGESLSPVVHRALPRAIRAVVRPEAEYWFGGFNYAAAFTIGSRPYAVGGRQDVAVLTEVRGDR